MVMTVSIDKTIKPLDQNRTIYTYITIGSTKSGGKEGFTIVPDSWNCTRPAYGSVGSYHITTSREALERAGLDIYKYIQSYDDETGYGQVPVDIYVTDSKKTYHLFGGELDEVEVDYDSDTVIITGRDWAGLLVDIHDPLAFTEVPGSPSNPGSASLAGNNASAGIGNAVGGNAPANEVQFTQVQSDQANTAATAADGCGVGTTAPIGAPRLSSTKKKTSTKTPPVSAPASIPPSGGGYSVSAPAPTSFQPFAFSGTENINANNITPSQFAKYIAQHNGFNPEIYTFSQMQTIGEYVGGLKLSMEKPRTLWGSLQFFARLFGWVCYVTPNRSLYFGPVPTLPILPVAWGIVTDNAEVSNALSISYNPRRNTNFLVVVRTFDTNTTAISSISLGVTSSGKVQASIVRTFPDVKSINNQVFYETQGAVVSHSLASLFEQLGKPVYFYGYDGKSPAQAMQYAYEKALEIAKRELIAKFTIDGNGDVVPMQPFSIIGDIGSFDASEYYAAGVEHSFNMKDGWYTHIHGWTLKYTNVVGGASAFANMNVNLDGKVANIGPITKM